jgi:hypothetical protein
MSWWGRPQPPRAAVTASRSNELTVFSCQYRRSIRLLRSRRRPRDAGRGALAQPHVAEHGDTPRRRNDASIAIDLRMLVGLAL